MVEESRRPFGSAGRGEKQLAGGAELVDEVGAVVVQVHSHAVGTESGRGEGSVGSAMEERLLAELRIAGDQGVLLSRVELDTAVHRVGQFEGGREVDLHAAAVGIGQR